jgi:diguanylate cyclase (GGDEF)-like protein
VKSNDELGLLSASFNQMSKDLSDAYDELEKSRKKMEEMSLQDPLTLLPNRRAFNESASIVIAQAYRHGRSCVLAMIDVDRFKDINDFYSHATGDRVLQLLGDVLRSNLREVDILARYGGEEFMVLFPETDLASAHKLMERLRIFISEHVWSDMEPEFRVTVSAGLVEVDVNELSAEPLDIAINAADKKLYKAKDNGRNRTES